ncbi:MAG TPA: ATP-binding protein [Gemmatimonadaceae bacterium]|jgi:PAS domain S-box-containing protein
MHHLTKSTMLTDRPPTLDDQVDSAQMRGDPARLAALASTQLLDSEVEETFDRLTRLAVRLVDVPAAFISLVDRDRDFYKSACGFGEPLASARELSGPTFCHFTIQSTQPLVIPDTVADPRYRDVPTVKSLGVAAYVGIPLVIDGQVIGAFCAIDVIPRQWTDRDISTLSDLAAIALREIEYRAAGKRSDAARDEAKGALARMGELFRQAPAFIAVVRGPDHVFEVANEEYLTLVGRRDILGKTVLDALPELRDQGFIPLLDEVLNTGKPFVGNELPVQLRRTESGAPESRFVNFVYQRIDNVDGTHLGVFVHGVDVTEQVLARRLAESLNHQLQDQAAELEVQTEEIHATMDELQVTTEELNERTEAAELARNAAERALADLAAAEARYRTLTEAVPVQVWTARPDGMLDFVSVQAATYFDVSAEEAIGTGWTNFVHPDDLPSAGARWLASLQNGTPYQAEFRLREGKTGEYRWHLARALPHRGADGAITGWTGSNTDVEGERRARADAEAANRAKSEFLAVMSHELRTPLNAIGGYAQLLENEVRGPVTETQRIDLERIQRSQRHLLSLINGILDYAKVGAGMMRYAVEAVSLDEILATCESLTMPQMRAKHLSFEFAKKTCLIAQADRGKVQQIVLNLVSNAVKFTEPGGHITASCVARDGTVALSVTDTGRGIPADQVDRVFEPFVQVDAKLNRDQPGTGLGLAISRDLARGMGGEITATSEVGVGSTFVLSLPDRVDVAS